MNAVILVGAGVLGYYAYEHWNQQPDNFGADRSQVVGSSTRTKASTDVPIFSSSYVANGIDGRNSQIPNPHLKERDPRSRAGQPPGYGKTYGVPQPDSGFDVEGGPKQTTETVTNALDTSTQWLKTNPASVPLNSRPDRKIHRFDTNTRSQMYLGAADTAPIASIPFSRGHNFDANKHFMDVSRAVKSEHHGTLRNLTFPAYGLHPKSAHTATGTHTRIYTGRHFRDDIK